MNRARSNTRDDYDKVKGAVHKLRSENRKLRKENAQLRKELKRNEDIEFDRTLETEEEQVPEDLLTKLQSKPVCPKCHADALMKIPAGAFVISFCNACGFRKRHEVKPKPE